jgi:hypothetical protein
MRLKAGLTLSLEGIHGVGSSTFLRGVGSSTFLRGVR